jgi:hypothetical protein
MTSPNQSIPRGFCQCGCGQKTNLAPCADKRGKVLKGEPLRFLPWHHARLLKKPGTTGSRNYAKLKNLGLCTTCKQPAKRNRALCESCSDKVLRKRGAVPNRNGPYANRGRESATGIVQCAKCGKDFPRDLKRTYCQDCRTGKCAECNLSFEIEEPKKTERYRYCSRACKHKAQRKMTGSLAGGWRGGIADANSLERGRREYREWRDSVFKRDDYTCQDCKQRGGELHAHHLMRFSRHPGLRTVVSNGLTLCETCHYKRHKWKRKNGQPVQGDAQ